MEGTQEYSLCIFCCYSHPTSPSPGGAEETLDKFIRNSGFFFGNGLSAEELVGMEGVSICPECLSDVSSSLEEREKVVEVETQVRQLQLQLLRLMTTLKETVNVYSSKLGKLRSTIKCSDETCLKIKLGDNGEDVERKVVVFRNDIVTGIRNVSRFTVDLSTKWHSTEQTAPMNLVKIKRSDKDPPSPPSSAPKKAVKPPEDRLHVCQYCGKGYKRPVLLRVHERSHTGETPFKCDQCPKTFKGKHFLVYHKKISHATVKAYQCSECSQKFMGKQALVEHFKSQHSGRKPFSCLVCGLRFAVERRVKQHMRERHKINRGAVIL